MPLQFNVLEMQYPLVEHLNWSQFMFVSLTSVQVALNPPEPTALSAVMNLWYHKRYQKNAKNEWKSVTDVSCDGEGGERREKERSLIINGREEGKDFLRNTRIDGETVKKKDQKRKWDERERDE